MKQWTTDITRILISFYGDFSGKTNTKVYPDQVRRLEGETGACFVGLKKEGATSWAVKLILGAIKRKCHQNVRIRGITIYNFLPVF